MALNSFILSMEYIPRYKYIAKYATELDGKATFFLRRLYPKDTFVPLEFGDVTISLHSECLSKGKECLNGHLRKISNEVLNENRSTLLERKCQPQISVGEYVVKVKNEEDMEVSLKNMEQLQDALELLLEKFVFKQFMVKFNKICVLKPKLNEQQFGQETDDDNNSYSIEINNLNAVDRENLMDTIREGQALLRRFDNASIQTCSMHTSMNDEIIDAVFGVDKKVKGCGFRDGQLQIHVQMPSLKCERQRIKSEMSDVLKTFKIDHMVIFGDYDITPFSGSKVGDKAENILGRTGTLGGFARIEGHLSLSECQLCALFARHFADPDEDNEEPPVYIFDQSGNKTAIGVVHRGNGKNKYDISAVAVVSEVENNKFKTSEGLYSPSQLCLFEHDQLAKFEELQVYIWANGEATPRRGKITIPYYRCRAMDGHYVLIEDLCVWDRETNALVRKRLCESGHSGAIFCSDDPNGKSINVYSMLVGMWNYKEVDNDASHKGVYMTFAVCKGLEDLSDKLGADIKLC